MVVHVKHALHGNNRPEEQSVRDRRGAKGLGEMVQVGAEGKPLHHATVSQPSLTLIYPQSVKVTREGEHTTPARTGKAVSTASANTALIIAGGVRSGVRKMWWISGFWA